jgi:hypothetical protein
VTTDEKYIGDLVNTPLRADRQMWWRRMNLRNFFAELKRRHVYRAAIAYGVVAWLLIQIATQVFPFFEVSNWVVRLVVMVTILGFPIALIIAWAFEMTPEGLKRADDVAPNEYILRWSTRRFVALIISVAILAAGVPLVHLSRSKPSFLSRVTAASALSQKSVAVLPLLNESGSRDDEYFSDGLSEELIAALAQVKGLRVIGRSSSFRFRSQKADVLVRSCVSARYWKARCGKMAVGCESWSSLLTPQMEASCGQGRSIVN